MRAQWLSAVDTLTLAIQLITGCSVSFTVTVNLHVLELPESSVAVLITVVVPFGKLEPLAGTLVTLTPGQLSLAVTTKVTLLAQLPGAVVTLRFAGQLITGFSVRSEERRVRKERRSPGSPDH